MWTCPKCGRTFKRQAQGHYCGEAPKDVTSYIQAQDVHVQPHLFELVAVIRDTIPNLNEEIKWSMPSFSNSKNSIQLAACKTHISLYVGSEILHTFQGECDCFTCKKDALYLPYNVPIPRELIKSMLQWIFQDNMRE